MTQVLFLFNISLMWPVNPETHRNSESLDQILEISLKGSEHKTAGDLCDF